MKTMELEFTKAGWNFRQVERIGDVAIYERWKGGRSHFEVVRIRSREAREAFGRVFEAGEFYPSSEEWGAFGWTCGDLASAKRRAATLIPSNS